MVSGAKPENEVERLASLRAHDILDTEPDPYLESLARAAARKLKVPIALINLVDADRQWAKAAVGLPSGYELPRSIAFCAHTILTPKETTTIPDAKLDARVADNPLVTGRPGFRFYAGAPITDAEGRALGALCVIDTKPGEFSSLDIEILEELAASVSARLELYLSNAELRESEGNYRDAAELNPYMPWTASPKGDPEDARGYWPSLVMPTNPMPKQGWMQSVHAEDFSSAFAAWSECLRSGKALDVEYRLRLTDGSYRWFRVRASPKRDPAGNIMRWYGTVEDIQDRKLATAAHKEAEALLRQALDVARLHTWELDLASRRLTASDASVVNFGLQLGAAPSSYDSALARIHPDDRARYGREVEQAWASGQELEIEYRSLWPDGTTHWIRITGHPTRDDTGKPVRLVGLSLDITEQRQAEQERQRAEARVEYLAHHDPLTGLANRRLFRQTTAKAVATASHDAKVALFRIDLDDFQAINDAMGHDIGDSVLKHAADKLLLGFRPPEMLARYGSDEFAAIICNVADLAEIDSRAQAFLAALHEPAEIGGRTIVLGASIGISVAPEDASDADQLARNAETALSRTKTTDRGKFHYFKPEMDAHLQDLAKIKVDLRGALERRELRLFYQPLIDLKSGRISSFEALMRWQHPVRGLVSPGDFIPIAEETGWIVPFGRWALEEATREAVNWAGSISVAVNLSPVQFRNIHLLDEVSSALENSGLPAQRLELEVTESLLLQDSEDIAKILRGLLRSGLRISMDDFGAGYSSLGYLRRFPFSKIKIDQSLVRDLPDGNGGDAVVQAIVGLAHSLGISVTSEGIETEAQRDFIRDLGCNHAQGYFFSRPVPASEVPTLLAAEAASSPSAETGSVSV